VGTQIVSSVFSTSSANELLLAFVATATTPGPAVTLSGAGLTWAPVETENVAKGGVSIFRAYSTAVLTNVQVTATSSYNDCGMLSIVSFTGSNSSGSNGSAAIGALGTCTHASGAGSNETCSLTATQNGSWVFGIGEDWDFSINRTIGSNQTMQSEWADTDGDTFWVQSQASASSVSGATVTLNDTAPTTDEFNYAIVEVLPQE
jgi:hypothetical protein